MSQDKFFDPYGLVVTWGMAPHDGGATGEGVVIGQVVNFPDSWIVADDDGCEVVSKDWCSWRGDRCDGERADRLAEKYATTPEGEEQQ